MLKYFFVWKERNIYKIEGRLLFNIGKFHNEMN